MQQGAEAGGPVVTLFVRAMYGAPRALDRGEGG